MSEESEQERVEEHYVEIHDPEQEEFVTVMYESFEALNEGLDSLFSSDKEFDVIYDLDEDFLTLEQYLIIANKNPKVANLTNPECLETIDEYRLWLNDFIELKEFENIFLSKD